MASHRLSSRDCGRVMHRGMQWTAQHTLARHASELAATERTCLFAAFAIVYACRQRKARAGGEARAQSLRLADFNAACV